MSSASLYSYSWVIAIFIGLSPHKEQCIIIVFNCWKSSQTHCKKKKKNQSRVHKIWSVLILDLYPGNPQKRAVVICRDLSIRDPPENSGHLIPEYPPGTPLSWLSVSQLALRTLCLPCEQTCKAHQIGHCFLSTLCNSLGTRLFAKQDKLVSNGYLHPGCQGLGCS